MFMNARSQQPGSGGVAPVRPRLAAGRRSAAAEALRDSLLDAAEGLLAERQAGAITSREIARAAGVSDGVLYNYFADKHELLLTALLRRFTRLVDAFTQDPPAAGASSVEAGLEEHIQRLFALQVDALPMVANLVSDPPLLHRFMAEIHRPPLGGDVFRRPIVDFLAGEQRLGRLGAFDREAAADLLVGAVLMQGLVGVIGHQPPAVSQERLAGIATTLLGGLQPRRVDPPPQSAIEGSLP